ncbi:MAG: 50S ribosomal protein L24 [candidate division WS6 bacterium GW2011_GWF2_39_15]|uniref:Large ribosomal subunit protein uL24 n=1 Tax=candidate division WS6 bacterium GW2011_GWF2_39_15 TaxID=1619100 RepID=A0A0G0QVL3_9BACT|nr:MAG: 50S ribosomal protein L24 [candidate division WS6 bacterium GW2011_GWF2_39_15]
MKIRKGDTVKVLYGKDAGKTAKVLNADPIKREVVVEGLNVYKKHIKGDGQSKKSEIVEKVKPMPASKVALICEHCGKPTRVSMKLEGKNYVRTCKNCGKVLDGKQVEKVEEKKVTKTKKVTKKSK